MAQFSLFLASIAHMEKFYYLDRKRRHPWGDYHDILMHGMSCHLGRDGGLIQLERTGPFVPPISFPGIGDIVVTDEFRRRLETSGLAGLRFAKVIKKLIVRSDWHTWDQTAGQPPQFPDSGEPEDYVLEQPHSTAAAQAMGELWELVLNPSARVYRAKRICTREDIFLLPDSWQGEDLFKAQGVGSIYASEQAKDWLEEHVGDYVALQEARTKETAA
jgi:hypothetical protein